MTYEPYHPPVIASRGWRVGPTEHRAALAEASGDGVEATVAVDVAVDMGLAVAGGDGVEGDVSYVGLYTFDMLPAESAGAGLDLTATPSLSVTMNLADGSGGTALTPVLSIVIPAVEYDATGAGAQANSSSISWNHTCSGDNRALIVAALNSTTGDNITATYNSVSMTRLNQGLVDNGRLAFFVLLNPASGTNSVVVSSVTADLAGTSVSYTGVTGYDTYTTNTGTGTTRSVSKASAEGEMVVCAFGDESATTMSSFSDTLRDTIVRNGTDDCSVLLGDAAGTGSTINFSATGSNVAWRGYALRLQP